MSEINRIIAEKVMGAKEAPFPSWWLREDGWYFLRKGMPAYVECYDYFDPEHNISHAHMALDKFEVWDMAKGASGYFARVGYDGEAVRADTPSEAICAALVEAVKEE